MNREPTGAQLMESMVADLRQAGYSIDTIARESGISKNTVWRVANGATTEPYWATYCKLRDFHDRVKR